MITAEKLARATAGIMSLKPKIDNDIPELTAEDIKSALGMIKHKDGIYKGKPHKGATLLLEVKYLDMHIFKADLFVELFQRVMVVADKENWTKQPYHRTELIWDMCKLALDEQIMPQLCDVCNGHKVFESHNLIVDCQKCHATGRRNKDDQQYQLKLTDGGWKYWRPNYRRILTKLDTWEGIGLKAVADYLTAY